ncbi:odorant receptor 13a-like [Vespula squamosa]|uniref:Odorant receptor 13a-like n=1 Tax=Vespula squamosa TaxID=30214 RepID=A0ABD2C261_VESSQ
MKELLKNTDDSHGRVRQMILRRYRLIRFVAISLRRNHIVLFFSGIVFNSIGFINNISNLIIVLKINLKSLCICMVRARKPLQLTGAKFSVVSLCTFTDVNHSEDIDGVLIISTNIYVNKRVKQLVLNIYYTGILLLTCR